MPTVNPRLNLTLEPHRHELLKRLASLQGVSMASLVSDMLEEFYPVLERVCVVLEAAKQAKESSKQGLRDAVAQAETHLVPLLYQAVDQLDIFVEDAARSVGVELSSDTRAAEAIRKAQAPRKADRRQAERADLPSSGQGSPEASGPRHVIRGSGSPTSPPASPPAKPSKALRHKESGAFSSSKAVEKIDGCTCKVTKRERHENPTCPVHRKEGR